MARDGVTVAASWLIACDHERKRYWGFWAFLLSNVLWVAWGWYSHAPALVALQFALAVMNVRGAKKTDPEPQAEARADSKARPQSS